MDLFFDNARRIFETASAARNASDTTILITAEGAIRMLTGSDWPLERLVAHHGAHAAYRVSRERGGVTVEGRSRSAACRLEQRSAVRALLGCA